MENKLTPANVARRERGQKLLESSFLLGRVDVEPGVERLGLLSERRARISPGGS